MNIEMGSACFWKFVFIHNTENHARNQTDDTEDISSTNNHFTTKENGKESWQALFILNNNAE